MSSERESKERMEQCIKCLHEDLQMLVSGDWIPDGQSVQASIDTLQVVADYCGVELEDNEGVTS